MKKRPTVVPMIFKKHAPRVHPLMAMMQGKGIQVLKRRGGGYSRIQTTYVPTVGDK